MQPRVSVMMLTAMEAMSSPLSASDRRLVSRYRALASRSLRRASAAIFLALEVRALVITAVTAITAKVMR